MAMGFISRATSANELRASLDASVQRTRAIADRVARASAQHQGFALPAAGSVPGSDEQGPIDVESEMVSLADEQVRFAATAKLLQQTYSGLRESIQK